jgi:cell division protein FtsA
MHDLQIPEQLDDFSPKTVIDGIIGPRLEELYKLIGEEMMKSTFMDQIPSGMVITGGGALTVGVLEMGRKVVGLPVRIGVPGGVTGLIDEILDPQFAATVGLILYGRKHMAPGKEGSLMDFGSFFKGATPSVSMDKVKHFFKQFIP